MTAAEQLKYVNNEIVWAASVARILTAVYLSDDAREVMANSAPDFFHITSIALQREMFLTLARLTDRPSTGRYESVCMRRLVESLDVDEVLREPLVANLARIDELSYSVRMWRDKCLAHNDLEQVKSDTPLDKISMVVVEMLVRELIRLAAAIGEVLSPGEVTVPISAGAPGGGRRLLKVLRQGLVGDDGYHDRDPAWPTDS